MKKSGLQKLTGLVLAAMLAGGVLAPAAAIAQDAAPAPVAAEATPAPAAIEECRRMRMLFSPGWRAAETSGR